MDFWVGIGYKFIARAIGNRKWSQWEFAIPGAWNGKWTDRFSYGSSMDAGNCIGWESTMDTAVSIENDLKIISVVEREAGIFGITPETKISDLGMDSLEIVSLFQCISDEIKNIPTEKFGEIEIVSDIFKAIE